MDANEIGIKSYLIINPEMFIGLFREHSLTAIDIAILFFIIWKYDANPNRIPVCVSYNDFEKELYISRDAIRKSLKHLLDIKIILKVNKRKGRAKTEYVPNVDYLQKLLIDFFKEKQKGQKHT